MYIPNYQQTSNVVLLKIAKNHMIFTIDQTFRKTCNIACALVCQNVMHSIILEFVNEFCCLNDHSYEFSASYLVIDPKLFRMTEFLFCLDEIYYFETLISAIQNLSTQILLRICKNAQKCYSN